MIPSGAQILLAAASIPDLAAVPVQDTQQGAVSLHPIIQEVPEACIKSDQAVILSLDLYSTPSDFDSFSSKFELILNAPSKINSIVGWFDV